LIKILLDMTTEVGSEVALLERATFPFANFIPIRIRIR